MTLDLKEALLSHPCDLVAVSDKISDQWISALFDLKGMTNPIHRKIVPSMYRAIPKRTVCASISQDGKIVATGLGILDRDYIGRCV